jgi:hypothetical protein
MSRDAISDAFDSAIPKKAAAAPADPISSAFDRPLTEKEKFEASQRAIRAKLAAQGALPADRVNYGGSPYLDAGLKTAKEFLNLPVTGTVRIAENLANMATALPQIPAAIAQRGSEAREAFDRGEYADAAAKTLRNAVPFVGGAVATAPEKVLAARDAYARGEVAEGLTHAASVAPGGAEAARIAGQLARGEFAETLGDIGTAALLKESGTIAKEATKPLREKLSKDIAPKIMRNTVPPTKGQVQFGADTGEAMVGLKSEFGEGVRSLIEPLQKRIDDIEGRASAVIWKNPRAWAKQIDILSPLQRAKTELLDVAQQVQPQSVARFQQIMDEQIERVRTLTNGSGVGDARTAQAYAQHVNKLVRGWSAAAEDGTLKRALQNSYTGIMDNVGEAVPEVKLLNKQLHSALQAREALENAVFHASKQDPLGAIAKLYHSPYIRTRLADLFRKLDPKAETPMPAGLVGGVDASGAPITGESRPWSAPAPAAVIPEVLRPRDQRLLPPSPAVAGEGFIMNPQQNVTMGANFTVGRAARPRNVTVESAERFAPQQRAPYRGVIDAPTEAAEREWARKEAARRYLAALIGR